MTKQRRAEIEQATMRNIMRQEEDKRAAWIIEQIKEGAFILEVANAYLQANYSKK